MTLHPGDLILTGTPSGTGAESGEFLKAGDVVKVWIEGIGEFSNKIACSRRAARAPHSWESFASRSFPLQAENPAGGSPLQCARGDAC